VSFALQRIRHASLQAISYRVGGGSFHLAALPTFLVDEELRSGVLDRAFTLPLDTGSGYYLYVPEEKVHLPPISAFIE
jgi:DNA-binding transcriptional LysR family regulator